MCSAQADVCFTPNSDIDYVFWHVCFGPKPDMSSKGGTASLKHEQMIKREQEAEDPPVKRFRLSPETAAAEAAREAESSTQPKK